MDHLHPLFCIVPPHILESIVERGSSKQREFARKTLTASAKFRSQRERMTEETTSVTTAAAAGKQRLIYDARNGTSLPGAVVRSEGDPAGSDLAVNEAYDGSGVTYDLFFSQYGRNSINGSGMQLNSTVHYRKGYDNAFWNGQQMVYGDGDEDLPLDQRLFNRFTIALDIIGHELTHGITQFEAGLVYRDQPGALNESFSDVFGSLVKQFQHGHTSAQADWIIGAGLFTSNVNGVGIRSMKEPGTAYNDPVLGKDPQPGHMDNYVQTSSDNGGVHINSGIPNRAFYAAALQMGGYAWEKAGKIWYVTLRDKLGSRSNFQDAASLTIQTAGELFGAGSAEQAAVQAGWEAVGLGVQKKGRGRK